MVIIEDMTYLAKKTPYGTRDVANLQYIVLHHTSTPWNARPENIKYHGSNGVIYYAPYHYLVYPTGRIVKTRPVSWRGICVEMMNSKVICVAGVGNWETDNPTTESFLNSMVDLLWVLKNTYNLEIVRHKDLRQTTCPGKNFPYYEIMQRLQARGDA